MVPVRTTDPLPPHEQGGPGDPKEARPPFISFMPITLYFLVITHTS